MSSKQSGGILLSLNLLLLLIALCATSYVAWTLWQDARQSPQAWWQLIQNGTKPVTSSPSPTIDTLSPDFTIDSALMADKSDLSNNLIKPLRAYYATKTEQLGKVEVKAATLSNHTAQVTYELIKKDGTTAQNTFFYDRSGSDRTGPYPSWEPSLLDNTK